jgi:hypothetical protein
MPSQLTAQLSSQPGASPTQPAVQTQSQVNRRQVKPRVYPDAVEVTRTDTNHADTNHVQDQKSK